MRAIKAIVLLCVCAFATSENFFNSASYLSKSAKDKHKLLVDEINKNPTPQGYFSGLQNVAVLVQDNWPTMNWVGDALPEGRKKLIHSEGVVAPCEVHFNIDSGYSGLFKENLPYSIIRPSAASAYDVTKSSKEGAFNNFTPGFALKVLVDGRHSENLVAMYDTTFQGSWDFFEHTFSNSFDVYEDTPFAKNLVARSFSKITNYISSVGLREWAEYNSDGTAVPKSQVKFPFRLFFEPSKDVKGLFKPYYTSDYKTILKSIPKGTIIYVIKAQEAPGCEIKEIGYIKLSEALTTSEFGDRVLFFRHLLIDLDNEGERKSHKDYRDYYGFFGLSKKKDAKGKCPFFSS